MYTNSHYYKADHRLYDEAFFPGNIIIGSLKIIVNAVDKETALSDACKVEHDVSEESFEAIKRALHSSHFS